MNEKFTEFEPFIEEVRSLMNLAPESESIIFYVVTRIGEDIGTLLLSKNVNQFESVGAVSYLAKEVQASLDSQSE